MIKNAFKNIIRRKVSSIITITAITIGVAAVMVISCISLAGKNIISFELANLGISGITVQPVKGREDIRMNEENLTKIQKLDGVMSAMPVLAKYIDVTTKNQTSKCVVWGISSGEKQVFNLTLIHGRLIKNDDIKQGSRVCVVDEIFAKSIYKRSNIVGKTVKINLSGEESDFLVVGVVSSGGAITQGILSNFTPYFLYLPFSTMQTLGGYENFSQVAVKMDDSALAQADMGEKMLKNQLEKVFNEKNAFVTSNMAKKKGSIDGALDSISLILALIAGISLVVSGLTVMIVMFSAIKERTREIGIKKAIGAKKITIAAEFLTEAVALSGTGAVVGIAIGTAIFAFGCLGVGIPVEINWNMVAWIFGFSVVAGGIFGMFPAAKAAKLNPVEAFAL